ncbi:macoilin [Manduca sexta]|uniref:macoilin n=1 Tax=Manduca sexta TaxID=7130 RepID=UPI00188FD5FF|nr:macoilin [Manduca sexta]
MKRRNADAGKMRRPLKRTKITEGMYGNSMLYLKFVMLWATVVMADYMLEFRFEFLWPFWMMLRSVYDSFKYQGLAFSMFFICIALTSDMICFFFIPLQYIFFAASTYVWVQYVWYTFAEKGICLPTVAICCAVVYVEGAWRGERSELCRPLAAHCVGFPAVSLGFGVKSYVGHRLRLRTQRHVRKQNEFYFQLMRDALPESALEQNQQQPPSKEAAASSTETGGGGTSVSTSTSTSASTGTEARHMNGSVRRRCKPELNGHCGHEHTQLHIKLEKLEKHLAQQTAAREREKAQQSQAQTQTQTQAHTQTQPAAGSQGSAGNAHALSNGNAPGAHADDDDHKHDHSKGGAKSSKYEKKEANSIKEEKKKNRHKDKDKESSDSHKSTEHAVKEQIVKEKDLESTKENVKSKECNNNKDKEKEKEKEKEREREKERETREREKEKEKEKERERERELRSMRSCAEELRRVRAELAAARSAEHDARRALAAAERQRRQHHQHKASSWRGARPSAEPARTRPAPRTNSVCCSAECESEWCRAALQRAESEAAALRRDLARATDALTLLRADLHRAADQVRTLEARQEARQEEPSVGPVGGSAAGVGAGWQALQERATHLERSLSAETRVKLDLLSALGDAKRKMHLQEGVISRQEKEIEELKAQMLAVMPTEFVTAVSGAVSKLRLADGSPLDPNASVYTPKQLCSDA